MVGGARPQPRPSLQAARQDRRRTPADRPRQPARGVVGPRRPPAVCQREAVPALAAA
jgi:hypothetical protein